MLQLLSTYRIEPLAPFKVTIPLLEEIAGLSINSTDAINIHSTSYLQWAKKTKLSLLMVSRQRFNTVLQTRSVRSSGVKTRVYRYIAMYNDLIGEIKNVPNAWEVYIFGHIFLSILRFLVSCDINVNQSQKVKDIW